MALAPEQQQAVLQQQMLQQAPQGGMQMVGSMGPLGFMPMQVRAWRGSGEGVPHVSTLGGWGWGWGWGGRCVV